MNAGDWVTPAWDEEFYKGEPTAEVLEYPAPSHYPRPQVRLRDLYDGMVFTGQAQDFRVVKTVEERVAEELMA